jgi:hypothetical protein
MHLSILGAEWQTRLADRVQGGEAVWELPADDDLSGVERALVEFVMTDGEDTWDQPPEGGNYIISDPGAYSLVDGRLVSK